MGRFGRAKRGTPAIAETIPDRALARQLIVGVLVSDYLVSQLCAVTGQTREQLLRQLDGNLPPVRDRQLDLLLRELSGSCALFQDPERPTYVGLGSRIEQLLKMAEDQSVALIEAARAEAARIVAEAEASGTS
jgi:transposase